MIEQSRGRLQIHDLQDYTDITYHAVEAFNGGDYAGAIEQLREMARVNPANIKVHEVLADAYLRTGQVDDAAREMYRARELAAERYPDLAPQRRKTFDDLVADARGGAELKEAFSSLIDSASAEQMLQNSDVPAQLGVKLMAAGKYETAERVLVRYGEQMKMLREQQRTA